MKTLLLLDGFNHVFRAYHAMQRLGLETFDGKPTGAIYGFLNMLGKLEKNLHFDSIAVVFDSHGKNFRHDIYGEYKANRGPMPDELKSQIEPLFNCLTALNLPIIKKQGFEADDLIGTLATRAIEKDYEVFISSGDKDFAQLINEKIRQYVPQKRESKDLILDENGVKKKYGVRPNQFRDFLALVGDSSDNVPGVRDCGPKTAASWLNEYGDLDNILDNASYVKGRGSKNLIENSQWLLTARKLVTIKTDVRLDCSLDSLSKQPPDLNAVRNLYEQLELRNLLAKLPKVDTVPDNEITSLANQSDRKARIYRTIQTLDQLKQWIKLINDATITSIDTETNSLNAMEAQLVGISLSIKPHEGIYIPVGHINNEQTEQLEKKTVIDHLKPWLENPNKIKVGQNIKYDMHVLANQGIKLTGVRHDTLLASYVVESHKSHKLDNMAREKLGISATSYESIVGKGKNQLSFDNVPLEQATAYAAEDADITLQLHHHFEKTLKQNEKLNYIYEKVEIPLIDILFQIERNGVLVDTELLRQQSEKLGRKILTIQKEVYDLAGEEFNLSSTKQLREILFVKKAFPVIKKTPGGEPSTDESVLQQLAEHQPLAIKLLEYRGLSKLKTTYTDKLPRMVEHSSSRIHTNYGQAIAITGRLSSSDPNLQNIPIKTIEGRKVREAFIAPENSLLISADYSQIELRIMAHLSGDKRLKSAFERNEDVHRETAAQLYGISPDAVSSEHRRFAKVINFGLIYGMSSFGLAKQLNIEINEAQLFIERYFRQYPGVKNYMDQTRQSALERGFVETVFGRRLYLPNIKKPGLQRKAAEREAINAPMQGTAADLIKIAMIRIQKWISKNGMNMKIIMQVHDELVLEVPDQEVLQAEKIIPSLMTEVEEISVPLTVEIGKGSNWEMAH